MTERLLSLLRREPDTVVSGNVLSHELGISRTAVWKKIKQLRVFGYEIESTRSSGYRLLSVPDKLLPEEIRNGLESRLFGQEIFYLEKTKSTNRDASAMARDGAEEGVLVVADSQTEGKGRLGRTWASPAGCNLYFSIILRPPILPSQIPQVTLMASVSLAETLGRKTSLPVRIKWPNDLWIGEKKVGGILAEMSADMDRASYVILGVGINVNMTRGKIPLKLRGQSTSLSLEAGRSFQRVELLQAILAGLEKDYHRFCREGFKPFQMRWTRASMTVGRPVHIRLPNGEIKGKALQINDEGYLQVEKEDGSIEELFTGDVTVMKGPDGRRRTTDDPR